MILDLYACAGGWDEGARLAGLGATVGIEIDHDPCRTAVAADVPDLRAEIERLTKLTATCVCYDGNPANYEGPQVDCPVHGAVRAFNEATREIERLRPIVEAAREFGTLVLRGSWSQEQAAEFIAATQARGEVR